MTEMPLAGTAGAELVATLVKLREGLQRAQLPLVIPDVEPARAVRSELLAQIDDYLLPRLLDLDAPLLTVVGGSTGAGKSTLVNSLIGASVTETGVLRPTTRSPVLVHNPVDAHWFAEGRILPGLRRSQNATGEHDVLRMVASTAIPAGLAVLDAPDIDSVEEQNRILAAELLQAADLWLFVTSAARYADHVPWEFLREAADRSAAVAIVLDRIDRSAIGEVSPHLARMLSSRGLRDSPLFVVPEGDVDTDGLLPSASVREIRAWLSSLAGNATARSGVIRQTLEGAIRVSSTRAYQVADACHDQTAISGRMRAEADDAYRAALERIESASAHGSLLAGEVLIRWQEFVGTGELLKGLDSRVGWLRDRVTGAMKGQPQQARRVSAAIEAGLQTLIREHAEEAAERTDAAWRSINAGRALLGDATVDHSRASAELQLRTENAIHDWQQAVLELVRGEGAAKRATARYLAYGVNSLGVALMVMIFSAGQADSGSESNASAEIGTLARKLLEAVFGDHAVRRLESAARGDLHERLDRLLAPERARFTRMLDGLGIDPDAEEILRECARGIDDIRFAVPR